MGVARKRRIWQVQEETRTEAIICCMTRRKVNQHSVIVYIAFLLIFCSIVRKNTRAQIASGLTEANACRHSAILARESDNASHTARCHIGTKVISRSSSMEEIVDKEWKWIYQNIESLTGQVISRETKRRKLFSMIECIDPGAAVGRWARQFYRSPGNGSNDAGVLLDESGEGGGGDAYVDCTSSRPHKGPLARIYYGENGSKTKEAGMGNLTTYMRTHTGQHIGTGDELRSFNFEYSGTELRDALFRDLEQEIIPGRDIIESRRIMSVDGFPYETGLTVIGEERGSVLLKRNVTTDNSVLSWNRVLAAEQALAGRRSPPVQGPPEVDAPQVLLNVLVALLAIVALRQTWRSTQEKRQERAREWASLVCMGEPVLICSRREQRCRSAYLVATSSEVLIIVGLIASAGIAIVLSATAFWNSNLIDSQTIIVNQGGVITYEGRVGRLREDPENPLSGSLFCIAHWMTLELEATGSKIWKWGIILGHVLLAIWVWKSVSMIAHSPELKYDSEPIQTFTAPFRWFRRVWRGLFFRIFSFLNSRYKCASYRSTFRTLCEDIPYSTGLKTNVLEERRHIGWRLGRIEPVPRDCQRKGLVEICAAVMTDYEWGLLSFPQVLYLQTDQIAFTALKRWTSSSGLPDYRESVRIASAYYVAGIVTTANAGGGEHLAGDLQKVGMQENKRTFREADFLASDGHLVVDLRGDEARLQAILEPEMNRLRSRNKRAYEAHLSGKLPKWLFTSNETMA